MPFWQFWVIFGLFLTCYGLGIFDKRSQQVFLSYFWLDWVRLAKKFWITVISFSKMLIMVNLAHFLPVFSPLQLWNGQKTLIDPVFMSVLVRVQWKTHPCDHNTLELAKKGVFTPKIAKKWIFERGALKLEQNGGQIRAQHEKICQNSEVPELNTIFGSLLLFLTLSSLTSYAWEQNWAK